MRQPNLEVLLEIEKLEKLHKDLEEDYLALEEKYSSMPVYEFVFGILRIASQMIYDCAHSKDLADRTIQASIYEGLRLSNKRDQSCNQTT